MPNPELPPATPFSEVYMEMEVSPVVVVPRESCCDQDVPPLYEAKRKPLLLATKTVLTSKTDIAWYLMSEETGDVS